MHITVLYSRPGTSTTEHIEEADEDTKKSALGIADTLNKMGHTSESLEIGIQDIEKLKDLKTDLVFNLVEWSGRESKYGVQVIEVLDAANLKYTGSHPWGYKLSCDKVMMKQEMDNHGIATPKWRTDTAEGLIFPVIVKPVFEHCGIGISQKSVVTNEKDLGSGIQDLRSKYKEPVLVEEYIDGLEAHVTILEKDGKPWVLPPAIIHYQKKEGYWGVLTYAAKWQTDWESKMSTWMDPQELSENIRGQITNVATQCYHYLGGRSYSRVDMRISQDRVYALEINNNPGIDFDPDSGITVAAKLAGLTWEALLQNIIDEALIVP